jgi:radical SAM protein with 4Fe4S-binding SPASM domain
MSNVPIKEDVRREGVSRSITDVSTDFKCVNCVHRWLCIGVCQKKERKEKKPCL